MWKTELHLAYNSGGSAKIVLGNKCKTKVQSKSGVLQYCLCAPLTSSSARGGRSGMESWPARVSIPITTLPQAKAPRGSQGGWESHTAGSFDFLLFGCKNRNGVNHGAGEEWVLFDELSKLSLCTVRVLVLSLSLQTMKAGPCGPGYRVPGCSDPLKVACTFCDPTLQSCCWGQSGDELEWDKPGNTARVCVNSSVRLTRQLHGRYKGCW